MSKPQPFRDFTAAEHGVWRELFERQAPLRERQLVPIFSKGLRELGITGEGVPDLEKVNRRLVERTGFRGVPVDGFEETASFFEMLARREFPIGNFIRDARDLNYTPAPDVFHDLYGHLPFLADPAYAAFCRELGRRGSCRSFDAEALTQFDRLFWFSVEFPLVETPEGARILGAGIASSFGECAYALSPEPEIVPFDVDAIRQQDFRIDIMQPKLFKLGSLDELYSCLDAFEAGLDCVKPDEQVSSRARSCKSTR